MRRSHAVPLALASLALVAAGLLAPQSASADAAAATAAAPAAADGAPPGTPTAHSFDGTPTVGAIFRGPLADGHECSGSVIASPTDDLVLTAAHCVYGDTSAWSFVPGYVDGRAPYGVWKISAAYVDPAWQKEGDTQSDYAILRIAPQTIDGRARRIQQLTGANLLGTAPRAGTTITDPAYNAGVDDQPITCTAKVYYTDGYPGFNCSNYQGGVSGSPFLAAGPHGTHVVVGLIAGLHQGGCFDYTSYSPRLTTRVYATYLRAVLHARPDTVVPPGSDGC
ncbi:trypsin-like serine peptidase [Frondihabitans australicus]|uniref:V8-like Glu-specific endopeptidase n=1 Tax=Frondihabitans australicus TaxID=386892 RepID=A0A495IMX3_9MICO|nr:trypsin-like serine protease [Frondihabitans australicus]RKR76475.1 V8-like Glu-specific endopeptidase [Frondihabitans australicus]